MGIDVLPGFDTLLKIPLHAIGYWPFIWWLVDVIAVTIKGRRDPL